MKILKYIVFIASYAFFISGCGSSAQDSAPATYVTSDGKLWAYGDITLAPTGIAGVESGIMLESLTPEKDLNNPADRANMQFQLYRATTDNSTTDAEQQAFVFADAHPDNKTQALSYVYELKFEGADKTVDIKAVLVVASPTYKNQLGAQSREVPIGSATFTDSKERAYVKLRTGLKIARVKSGPGRGRWALYEQSDLLSKTSDQASLDGLCREATRLAGTIGQITATTIPGLCQPSPTEFDFCDGDPTAGDCIPLAPVVDKDPFDKVGSIDVSAISSIKAINADKRQYQFRDQTALDAKVDITFVAKTIKATNDNNAELCKLRFEAKAWTIGNRINPACQLTPAPSPYPQNGFLACRVFMQFESPQSYQEKNCYVRGLFGGETDSLETVQILTP